MKLTSISPNQMIQNAGQKVNSRSSACEGTCKELPDLVILDVKTGAGGYDVTIKNQGKKESTECEAKLQIDGYPAWEEKIPGLKPGETYVENMGYIVAPPPYRKYWAEVDSKNVVKECDENNNKKEGYVN